MVDIYSFISKFIVEFLSNYKLYLLYYGKKSFKGMDWNSANAPLVACVKRPIDPNSLMYITWVSWV